MRRVGVTRVMDTNLESLWLPLARATRGSTALIVERANITETPTDGRLGWSWSSYIDGELKTLPGFGGKLTATKLYISQELIRFWLDGAKAEFMALGDLQPGNTKGGSGPGSSRYPVR